MDWQKTSRYFLIFSILFNIVVYLIGGYISVSISYGQPGVVIDFYSAFMPAVQRYLANPTTLYELTSLPFRSFPSLVFYFMLFYFIPSFPFHLDLLASAIFIFAMNLICCFLVIKITSLEQFKAMQFPNASKYVPILLGAYLLMPGQGVEYGLGQVNVITNTFLLLAVYFALKKDERFTFFFLGCAGMFKITALLLLPIFLFENIRKSFVKKLVNRLVFFGIPFIPSIAMFLIYRNYIPAFIKVNMTLTNTFNETFRSGNTSIAKFIATVFNVNVIPVLIVTVIVMYAISWYILIKFRLNIIERFMLGVFVMMLAFSDFYGVHLLFILGITILWFLTRVQFFGWKYKLVFLAIAVSYFGWTLDPLSVIVVSAFFACFVINVSKQQAITREDHAREIITS